MKITIQLDGLNSGRPTARAADLARRLVAEQQQRMMGGPRFFEAAQAGDAPITLPQRL